MIITLKIFGQQQCVFFRGSFCDIGLLLSSVTLFVASTRLIRSGVGAIDIPDQYRQLFDQNDPSEVPEKFSRDFSMACREKMFIFSRQAIEKSPEKIFQGLRMDHIDQKVDGTDQGYQSHQLLNESGV